MAKDKVINQRKPNLRRIGNRYDLLKLSNFQTSKKGDDYEFSFEFMNEDIFDRIYKVLYFTPKEAEDFYTVLHAILGGFGITIPENIELDNQEEEEENEGEGEGEEEEGKEEYEEGEGEEGEGEGKMEGEKKEDEKQVKKEEKKEDEKKINKQNVMEEGNNNNNITKKDMKNGKEESKEIRDVEIVA